MEVQRKMLELDAQSRRDSIAKYKTQQFQTRKNDEFQAISQEIHRFEKEIEQIEDHEIELMEHTEQIQKEAVYAELELKAAKRQSEQQQADLKKKVVDFGRAFATRPSQSANSWRRVSIRISCFNIRASSLPREEMLLFLSSTSFVWVAI